MKATQVLIAVVLVFTSGALWADNQPAGAISGVIGFPSEYIPAARVYAITEDGKRAYAVATKHNQKTFTIKDIPPGRYIVVAHNAEENPTLRAGGWTNKDGSLVVSTVTSGKTVTSAQVTNWHDDKGVFPPEPAPGLAKGVSARACENRDTQIETNGCNMQAYAIADKMLNAEYQRVADLVKAKPLCRDSLKTAQRAWIAFRDAQCTYEGEAEYSGRNTECLAELTAERANYFQKQTDICIR